jgi:hypothetical protein
MPTWRIGDVSITKVVELEAAGGLRFVLPDATREAVAGMRWMQPHFMNETGTIVASVHALVIETPSRRIVVDTCLGTTSTRRSRSGTTGTGRSSMISPPPVFRPSRSTPCCARTCTSITSVGTRSS